MSVSVDVNNLSKSYGKKKEIQAVKEISFEVSKGELFGIIGPDGAGKTSLFRMLTTLLLPDGGSASVDGSDIIKDYKSIRNKVGYMPGRFSLYQDLSVEENLGFFATIFNTSVKQNYDLIKDIYAQIEPFKKRKAGKLSGGMKQKLALSCALIHRPVVLFLDEPTTGVDAVSRKEFWEMLKRLKEQGITILVSTPYMDEAGLCDRIGLMQEGKLLSAGTPKEITAAFKQPILSIKANNMYALLKDLNSYKETEDAYSFGEYHHVVMQKDYNKEALQQYLEQKGYNELIIKNIEPSVEDSFMKLMRNSMTGETIISAKQLTKRFNDFTAVDSISFNVYKGEIFGFLGANGAGKTTAMRMLCGLSLPTSGEATIAGFNVYRQTEQIKKSIGYMSQKFSLYEDLTVKENIRFYGGIYGKSNQFIKDKTAWLLQQLHLQDEAGKLVGSLPLGWKQKLAFSVAVFHEPKIVFLDEPTGGVDPVTRREFWNLIYEAAATGITIFVTTHYMDEAEYCNHVSIMVDGRIDALDSPVTLKEKFKAASMDEVFLQLARKANRTE